MLTAFGSVAVSLMFASYWLEPRSKWFVLAFAYRKRCNRCFAAVYPIMVIEALWAVVALRRFITRSRLEFAPSAN